MWNSGLSWEPLSAAIPYEAAEGEAGQYSSVHAVLFGANASPPCAHPAHRSRCNGAGTSATDRVFRVLIDYERSHNYVSSMHFVPIADYYARADLQMDASFLHGANLCPSGAGVAVGRPQRGCLGVAGTQASDGAVERLGAAAGLGRDCAACGEIGVEVFGDVAG
jgi:hypothetical protein